MRRWKRNGGAGRIRYARLPETDHEKRTREADKEGGKIKREEREGKGERKRERERKVNYRFHDKLFARSNRRGITART